MKRIPELERYPGPPKRHGECVMCLRQPWTDGYFCDHCRDTHSLVAQIGAVWRYHRRKGAHNG